MAKIIGKIISERNRNENPISAEGVAFANVYTQKDNKITKLIQADDKGQFNLDINLGDKFKIAYTGYLTTEFTADKSGAQVFYLPVDPRTNLDEVTKEIPFTKTLIILLLAATSIYLLSKKRKK